MVKETQEIVSEITYDVPAKESVVLAKAHALPDKEREIYVKILYKWLQSFNENDIKVSSIDEILKSEKLEGFSALIYKLN